MIDQASLVLGEGNWAVKSDSLLGYKTIDGKYYPREFTFTRATTGTRVNEAGLVELVPYNLLQQSNTFNNVLWQLIGTPTITANYDTNPLTGENDAWRFQSSGVDQRIYQVLNNSFCTFSLYAKGSGNIRIRDSSSTHSTNLTLTSSWQRFLIYIPASFTNVQISASTGGCDATIYGAQLVEGTEPLDYLPTTDRLDIPRIDYSTGEPALLVEPQRTNLVTYSEQIDNAAWTKTNVTISPNATTSPDGYTSADKIIANAISGDKIAFQARSITIGQEFTISSFFKKSEYKLAFVRAGGQSGNPYVIYNLDTQVVVSTSGASSTKIEDYGNGWYRILFTVNSATGGTCAPNVSFLPDSGYTLSAFNIPQYTGDATSGGFVWGCQLEANGASYATSYIPTTSASVTRNQDVCSKTGATALIGQTEGTLFAEIDFDSNVSGSKMLLGLASNGSNFIYFFIDNSALTLSVVNSGSFQAYITYNLPTNGKYKIAAAYKLNDFVMYANGTQVASDTSGSVPTTSILYLGNNFLSVPNKIEFDAAAIWKERLTNAELATLTTI